MFFRKITGRELARWFNRPALRKACSVMALILCMLGTWGALRIGLSRTLTQRALRTGSLAEANRAVQLSPNDPEVYRARAANLSKRGEFGLAVEDLRQAIVLRPSDYTLWTELGKRLEKSGDPAGAVAALAEAQKLAPMYVSTHWNLGILLLEQGQRDEAFRELRSATLSQPALFRKVIDLASQEYGPDSLRVAAALNPRNTQERLALAHYFIGNSQTREALKLVREIDALSNDDRRELLTELVKANCFAEAYEVWADGNGRATTNQSRGVVDNGGFEEAELSHNPGFTWRIDNRSSSWISIDSSERHNGARSLRIDWQGNPSIDDETVSQLLLIDPGSRYRMDFVARAKDLLTGGAPIVQIIDAGQNEKLGQSSRLPLATSSWEKFSVEFTTTAQTRAVRIILRRENCAEPVCPIFGSLWLDDFSLQRQESERQRAW